MTARPHASAAHTGGRADARGGGRGQLHSHRGAPCVAAGWWRQEGTAGGAGAGPGAMGAAAGAGAMGTAAVEVVLEGLCEPGE